MFIYITEVNNWSSNKKKGKIVKNNLVYSFVECVFFNFCIDTNDNQLTIYSLK